MKKVNMMLVCAVALAMAGLGAPPPAKNAVPPHPAPHSGMVPRPLPPVPPKKGLLPKGALRVRPSEARSVKLVKYRDPSGYFTMNVPHGWRVKVGLKQSGKIDLISYAITMYDPKRPERELYLCLNDAFGLKSQEARNWYARSYGASSYFAQMPVLGELSTAGFFAAMGPLFGRRKFTVLERLGKSALGGEVVVAESTAAASGRRVQGLYHAMVSSMRQVVQRNPFKPGAGLLDVGVVTEFTILSETAPKEEFLDWQPVLDRSLASLSFTESFHRQRRAAWAQVMGTSRYIMQTGDSIRGMIMDSYRRRNATYDILSQKRSDATLGYERVQDTETGEYYRAENGFTDWYRGTRYRPAPEKAAYLSPVSGYINWK